MKLMNFKNGTDNFVGSALGVNRVERGGASLPNLTLWRRLFERSEFLSHLDSVRRRRGHGEPALSRIGGDAHGRKWFWALLPKQKYLVVPGRNPAL